jgi:Flp pilus assembly protein CpaB
MTLPPSRLDYIAQGDYINVIATVSVSLFAPSKHGYVTRTVFPEVYVLLVGPKLTAPQSGVVSTLTVLMTECDAEYMTWLLANATLTYSLIAIPDYAFAVAPSTCPSNQTTDVTAAAVDARWGFSKG